MAEGQLAGRIALITGAARGLGAAVAKRFAAEGAHLILVDRIQGGLEEVDDAVKSAGGTATLVPLDLLLPNGIEELGARVAERFRRLDILVGNAAVLGTLGPAHHLDIPVWEQTIATNLTANWRLIRSVDPLLRQSAAGRAIFVTADVARLPKPFWGAYAASKAGLETLVRMYAAEIPPTSNLRVNLVDPGRVGTALRARAYPGEKREKLPRPDDVTEPFVRLAEAGCDEQGALVAIE
jgi:NAD(P)-dependent dehydrogenase (short-subunit alcohol dehydrogenase family)